MCIMILGNVLAVDQNTNKLHFIFSDEQLNISVYTPLDGQKVTIKNKGVSEDKQGFGFVYDKDEVTSVLASQGKTFNNLISYDIQSSKQYTKNINNPYVLERDIQGTREVKNQLGIIETRQLKRFLNFEAVFHKQVNLYDEIITEISYQTCTVTQNLGDDCILDKTIKQNVTTLTLRDIGFSLVQGSYWVANFINLFDLDPVFTDDTDSNFDSGTFNNMITVGTGADANLTSNNSQGHYGSQIFDSTIPNANFTNITVTLDLPYGVEIGRDINNETNLTGLVALYHFNNETGLENNSLIYDFSVDVNPERLGETANNITCTLPNGCPANNFTNEKFGNGSKEFEFQGIVNHAPPDKSTANMGNMTLSAWIYPRGPGQGSIGRIVAKDNATNGFYFTTCGPAVPQCTTNLMVFVQSFSTTDGLWRSSPNSLLPFFEYKHVVVTFDNSAANDPVFYIDGSISTTFTIQNPVGTVFNDSGTPLAIGNNPVGGNVFNGTIDEVAIWNRTLSSLEIKNLYRRGAIELNLSVRSCDDNACNGESYKQITDTDFMGSKVTMDLIPNRFFQYNFTYSNNATSNLIDRVLINTVEIQFDNLTNITELLNPIVTLNLPLNNSVVEDANVQFNITATDDVGLANATLFHNLSGTFSAQTTNIISGLNETTVFAETITLDNIIVWNAEVCDSANNCSFAVNNFTLTTQTAAAAPINIFLVTPVNNSVVFSGNTIFTFFVNTTVNASLFINNVLNQTIEVSTGNHSYAPVLFSNNQTLEWFVNATNAISTVSGTFNLTIVRSIDDAILVGSCPTTTPETLNLWIFIGMSLFFITIALLFQLPFIGVFGSFMLMVDSWYIVGCIQFFGLVTALLSLVLLVYFTLAGLGFMNKTFS